MKKRVLIILTAVMLGITSTGCRFRVPAGAPDEPAEAYGLTAEAASADAPETVAETEPIGTTTPAITTAEPQETKPAGSKHGFADDDLSDLFGGKSAATTAKTAKITTAKPAAPGFPDDDLSDLFGGKSAATTAKSAKTTTAKPAAPGFPDDDLSDLFGGKTAATTAKTAKTTTAKPAKNDEPTEASEIPVLSFKNTEFVQYTYANNRLKLSGRCPTLYDFADAKSVGIGKDGRSVRFTEMSFGVTAKITRKTLTYRTYNNSDKKFTVISTVLEDDNSSTAVTTAGSKDADYDISGLPNGLYRLRTKFSTGDYLSLYFCINGGEAYLCSADSLTAAELKTCRERREKVYSLIRAEGITANDCLDTSQLCYPYYPYNENYRCDTQRWIDLSYQICDSSWTAEHKLFALHEWMTANLAYDYYKKDVLGMTRARYYSDWSGTHATYTTHVGVCADFSDILITMCRAQGIPITTIVTNTHVWNAVYLNGIWTELDMTCDINRAVYGEDTTKVVNAKDIYDYTAYFTIPCNRVDISEMIYANICIGTIAFATGKDNNRGLVV